jgi:hypothetical protein
VIRDNQEIQRPVQPRRHAGAGHDRLAPREPIGILGPQRTADHAGIRRITGVQVRISEEHLVRIVLFRVRGILGLVNLCWRRRIRKIRCMTEVRSKSTLFVNCAFISSLLRSFNHLKSLGKTTLRQRRSAVSGNPGLIVFDNR